MKKKALGRGLETLIPEKTWTPGPTERVFQVELDRIIPNRYQPRKVFSDQGISDLVESIRVHGIIQPILLRSLNQGGYELIAGERRLRAARSAGLATIPAIVTEATHERSLELALIENIQREDLNALEAAEGYQRLIDEFHLTQEEIAKTIGKDRATIANTLRVLTLPEEVKKEIAAGHLTMGHAKALLSLTSRKDQIEAAYRMVHEGLSVRSAEALTKKGSGKQKATSVSRHPDAQMRSVEERLQRALGTKVRIQGGNEGGKIVVDYFGLDDLQRILERCDA